MQYAVIRVSFGCRCNQHNYSIFFMYEVNGGNAIPYNYASMGFELRRNIAEMIYLGTIFSNQPLVVPAHPTTDETLRTRVSPLAGMSSAPSRAAACPLSWTPTAQPDVMCMHVPKPWKQTQDDSAPLPGLTGPLPVAVLGTRSGMSCSLRVLTKILEYQTRMARMHIQGR